MLGLRCTVLDSCTAVGIGGGYLTCAVALGNNPSCRMPEKCSAKNKPLTRKETRELDVKISFLEGLVRRDPQYVEALQMLGDHYTQRGKY